VARAALTAPVVFALHGSGMDGRAMARFTGLGVRGPAAGATVVFPDGWQGVWHPLHRPPGNPAVDDVAFLNRLRDMFASEWGLPLTLAGASNGAWFAEHVARNAQLDVSALFLVAGTSLKVSRDATPVPLQQAEMMCLLGTADRSVPFNGGPLTRTGAIGAIMRRRAARHGEQPGEAVTAGAVDVAADWARGNGITTDPVTEQLPGDLPVTRYTWAAAGRQRVVLYRIEGGGHGWPGGPQFLPAWLIGRIPRRPDATDLLLEIATRSQS
jgi:polyhydroxybutyrate depolymerase